MLPSPVIVRERHLVPAGLPPTRLSRYAHTAFSLLVSRKAAVKAIKRGEIRVNGETGSTGDWIQPGQLLELLESMRPPPKRFPLPLDVLVEDDFLAIIDKPGGFEVSGNRFQTIENALPGSLTPSLQPDALPWPRPVHRLDYSTRGLLLVAKTARALVSLSTQFEERTIHKQYQAVVVGNPGPWGQINRPVDERTAKSAYTTLQTTPSLRNGCLSLVQLIPHTGRRHQLRIHMASIGHPIVGDQRYGQEGKVLQGKGLFLAATKLEFTHPDRSERMNISIDAPGKFASLMQREQRRWKKFQKNEQGSG